MTEPERSCALCYYVISAKRNGNGSYIAQCGKYKLPILCRPPDADGCMAFKRRPREFYGLWVRQHLKGFEDDSDWAFEQGD